MPRKFIVHVGYFTICRQVARRDSASVLNQRVAKCISMGIFQPLHFGRCGLPLPVQRGRCATRHRRRALPAL